MASDKVILYVDGCSLGNPGPGGIGAVLLDEQGSCVAAIGEPLAATTNNVAEYRALLRGLEEALKLGFDEIEVRTDSELMERQISGRYRVRMEHLKPLRAEAVRQLKRFGSAAIHSVPRESNVHADALARRAAKLKRSVDGLSEP